MGIFTTYGRVINHKSITTQRITVQYQTVSVPDPAKIYHGYLRSRRVRQRAELRPVAPGEKGAFLLHGGSHPRSRFSLPARIDEHRAPNGSGQDPEEPQTRVPEGRDRQAQATSH